MGIEITTNLKPNTSLNSVYSVKQLIESLGGADKVDSDRLKNVLKEFEEKDNIESLVFKINICRSHKAKDLSKLNDYVKAIVCAINLDNEDCKTSKQKIHVIKSALLIEKLSKDHDFINKKNKFNSGVLKNAIGEYVDNNSLDRYLNRAKELIDINFLQFGDPVLGALEVLRSKNSSKALVDCQMRINSTDVSIFKEFDTTDAALQYVRVYLLDDIKQQQKSNQISERSLGTTKRSRMR